MASYGLSEADAEDRIEGQYSKSNGHVELFNQTLKHVMHHTIKNGGK